MYDTVNISLSNKLINNIDMIEYLKDKLNNISIHSYQSSNSISISGYLRNLKCIVTKDKLQIKDNSICKFLHGHNFKSLTLYDTRLIIEEISDLLCLPIEKAEVKRIDIGSNFILKYDSSVYLNRLGILSRFNRIEQSKGIYYNNSIKHKNNSIQLVFYNKYAEHKDKGFQIPTEFNNPNLFRYELRYLKKLPKHLNQKEIKASDLYNSVFYNNLTNSWVNYYRNIIKIYDIGSLDFTQITSTKDLTNIAINQLVSQSGGSNEFIKRLKEASKMNYSNRKVIYDIKKKVLEANSINSIHCNSDFISELDEKIGN